MSEKHGMSEEEWASVERETKAFKAEWIKKCLQGTIVKIKPWVETGVPF